jgi:hypothetical protein
LQARMNISRAGGSIQTRPSTHPAAVLRKGELGLLKFMNWLRLKCLRGDYHVTLVLHPTLDCRR